jgi:hypothetical protein
MKDFELRKWGGAGKDAKLGEVVARGSFEDVVEFAATNGLTWNKLPKHPLGGCFIKVIGPDTMEAYELAPAPSAAVVGETKLAATAVGENEFVIRAKMNEIIEYAQNNDLKFRKLIKDEPAVRSFAWWALKKREADERAEES